MFIFNFRASVKIHTYKADSSQATNTTCSFLYPFPYPLLLPCLFCCCVHRKRQPSASASASAGTARCPWKEKYRRYVANREMFICMWVARCYERGDSINVIRIDSSRAPNPIRDTFGTVLACGPFPWEFWHLILKYLAYSALWFSAAQLTVGNRLSTIGNRQSAGWRSFRQRYSAHGFRLFAYIAAHLPTLHKLGSNSGMNAGVES